MTESSRPIGGRQVARTPRGSWRLARPRRSAPTRPCMGRRWLGPRRQGPVVQLLDDRPLGGRQGLQPRVARLLPSRDLIPWLFSVLLSVLLSSLFRAFIDGAAVGLLDGLERHHRGHHTPSCAAALAAGD